MKVPFSYLPRQFNNPDPILAEVRDLIVRGALTLGKPVDDFERDFAALIGTKHAVGVGSGTDALFLSLKALDIGAGDEVITAVNTFVATVGAIETAGARTRFVDCGDDFVMDVDQVEAAVSDRTKAIIPVHYTGQPVDMPKLMRLADRLGIPVVEDSCTAVDASIDTLRCGAVGITGCFSFHPLKNLNIWGDGGMITTNDDAVAEKLRLMRNHGMIDRDTYAFYAYNSRLDTIQAVVAQRLLPEVVAITQRRIEIAHRYDAAFAHLKPVRTPERRANERHVFHLYIMEVDARDQLLTHLKASGISAKIHYPTPLHLQPASAHLGYQQGDFPVAERHAGRMITLPCHQHLSDDEVAYVIDQVRSFYG